MLSGVGEVEPAQLDVPPGAGVLDRGRDPHHRPAERQHRVRKRRVLAHERRLIRQMDRVVIPVLQADTTLSDAPSPTKNSTLSAYVAEPLYSSTTTADAFAPMSTTMCPAAACSADSPTTLMTVGCRGDYARGDGHDCCFAETGERPSAHPVRRHEGGADPSISALCIFNGDVGIGTDFDPNLADDPAAHRRAVPGSRRSGVNRHCSSRPVGTAKSDGSKEPDPCKPDTGPTDSTAPASELISRPPLPSAARSAG